MSGGRRRVRIRLAGRVLLAGLLVSTTATAAAQVLILRSVGPSARQYPAGQRLPDGARFSLRPGDVVSILHGRGTRTFRGPGTFAANLPVRLQTATPRGVRIQTGAVRGNETDRSSFYPPSMWDMNVMMNGRFCFRSGGPVLLWRPDTSSAGTLSVTNQTGTSTISWPANSATMILPTAVPLRGGSTLDLRWSNAAAPVRVTLAEIRVDPDDDAAVAAAFLDNKCSHQLDNFIYRTDEEGERP